jgi:4-amino-4-deoxy-L-arabinose transferase-like glycosyltransferase
MFQRYNGPVGHRLLLCLVWAALCLPNLGTPSLWDVDEGHNAEAAREMLVAGDPVVPTFNYRWRHDKPPLLYWLQMAAYQAFGVNEWSARLPSALAGLAAILLAYEFGRRMFSPTTGLLAGLILASTVLFSAAAHFANPDALLLVFSSLTLLIFWWGYVRDSRSWFVPAGLSAGLAVLTKGPVGVVLPSAVILTFLIWCGRLRFLCHWRFALGILTGSLVALPWYIAVIAETKGVFFREFFLKHNAGRFGAPMEGHGGPWFYYLICIIVGFAPWSVFLGPTLTFAVASRARADDQRPNDRSGLPSAVAYRFLWCWIAIYLLFFSLSATKLPNYVLPVYPPLALLTARFLDRWRLNAVSVPDWLMAVCMACMMLTGIAVAAGLMLAGGLIDASFLRGRALPGLERWAVIGIVPILGAGLGWYCLRHRHRNGLVISTAATAGLFVALLAAGGATAVDAHKAARPLVAHLPLGIYDREVRIGCYGYYQPSVVFYCRREVTRFETDAAALEFLKYPLEVYLFVPASFWEKVSANWPSCRLLANHYDLYAGENVVLVTNR